ncbi:MAG: SDR family NAD(P)-dependent oxidoreductase, partial [bacterium]|nr:SDR family NAD(P)-dependent oxidoreductase [bacterium]
MRCRSIDVVLDGAPGELAEQLIAELSTESSDAVIAWRGGTRWAQGFAPAPLDPPEEEPRLRPQGVYLITGGMGGLGLVFARHLAEACRARLVLIDRSAPDELRIRRVQELEALGAEVLVETADVCDPQAMGRVVQLARERFGALHGVIHAAGLAGGGVIQLKRREAAEAVLRPKVEGTRVLASVLREADLKLDFLVFFSSITAHLGTFGQVDYCAANNVLDAYARALAAERPELRATAVAWGPWEGVGMAAEAARAWDVGEPAPSAGEAVNHPLLDRVTGTAERAVFTTELRAWEHWVLSEHRVLGRPTVPGATYLEMARAAFAHQTGRAEAELRDVLFLHPLALDDDQSREVRVVLEPDGDDFDFRVTSRVEGRWEEHARGRVGPSQGTGAQRRDPAEIAARCGAETAPSDTAGDDLVSTGPRWQSLRRVHLGSGEGLVLLELDERFAGDIEDLALHPALLDLATGLGRGLAEWQDYLPMSYGTLRLHRPLPRRFYSHLRRREETAKRETLSFDVTLLAEDGTELVTIEQFTMKRVGAAAERLARPGSAPDDGVAGR